MKYDAVTNKYTSNKPNVDEIAATLTPKLNANIRTCSTELDVFPDSGASICLGGTEHLDLLGLTEQDLIPSAKTIVAVG